jgi:serine/threonine protein kinase
MHTYIHHIHPHTYTLTHTPATTGHAFNPVKADLYCCGVMLFIMMLGFPPYKLPDPSDARFNLVHGGRNGRVSVYVGVCECVYACVVCVCESI